MRYSLAVETTAFDALRIWSCQLLGGNSGVGIEIVKQLLTHNAKVYIAARNRDTALAVIETLKKETGHEALFIPLDLTDFKSIRSAAEEFLAKE